MLFLFTKILPAMDEKIKVGDLEFVKYIDASEIDAAVDRVAAKVNEEYKNDIPLILVTLNGAIMFAADLLKKLTVTCQVTCVKLASYAGTQTTNEVKNVIGLTEDLKDRRVLIIEDIVDTGTTYEYLWNLLHEKGVKDVKMATMTFKEDAYKKPYPVDFAGIVIQNKFVVGRGLDYNGLGRNLVHIYQVVR